MTITTRHSSSSYGMPVILDDAGLVMDYAPGIKAIRAQYTLSIADLARICGASERTIEGWQAGRPISDARYLNALGDYLEDHGG